MSILLDTAKYAQIDLAVQLPRWRTRLLQERAFRLEQLTALDEEIATTPTLAYDDVVRTLRAGAAATVEAVEAALWRMDHGRFGCCEQCSRPIAADRLEVLPMAALCMSCHREGRPASARGKSTVARARLT